MISVNQRTLRDSIEEGILRAKQKEMSLLVTHVEKVNHIDPLLFFENGQALFLGKRFFWKTPKNVFLVGLGTAATFEADGKNRAQSVKKQWEQVLKQSFGKAPESGTGLVLTGGFSFDPLDEKPSLWEGFPEAGFVIPEILLTVKEEETWLSINMWIEPENELSQIADRFNTILKDVTKPLNESKRGMAEIEAIKDHQVDEWLQSVEEVTRRISNGELEKVVLSREVSVTGTKDFDLRAILFKLIEQQTNSYVFAFEKGVSCFLGATPERLVEKEGEWLKTGALAGTAGRGQTPEEDQELGNQLLLSSKNRKEHQYVVQMIQQAMEGFCSYLDVPSVPQLLKVRDVQHLFTPISGQAKSGALLLDIIEQLHPTPALGGQPREKALSVIRELETYNRGWYASPIGWMDSRGQGEFAVAIRSGLIRKNEARLFAGCGVVEDSIPMDELEETHLKLRPMIAALEGRNENDSK